MRKVLYLLLSATILSSCAISKTSNDFVFPTRAGKNKYITAYNSTLKLFPVGFREDDVNTRYGSAHVIICGPANGKPLVLLHGTDASSTMWYPNIGALSKNYRVYAIDYPMEAGKSVAHVESMPPKDMIVFYNEVFDFYKLKDMVVVGASRGGWVATLLALQENNTVKSLVLLSPAQTFGGINSLGKALSALKLKLIPNRKRMKKFFDAFSYYPEKIDEQYKKQFFYANKFGRSKPDLMKMVKFTKKELNGLKIPVLVLVGDHDVINNVDILEKAKELIPNVETDTIKDAGHFLSIDQSETVNNIIVAFLNKNP